VRLGTGAPRVDSNQSGRELAMDIYCPTTVRFASWTACARAPCLTQVCSLGRRALNHMLLAVIVDQMRVTAWQAEALSRVADTNEFILLNCTNTRSRRRMIKHALYYALNFFSLRTQLTQLRPIPSELRVLRVSDFEAEDDGVWQKLPKEVVEQLKEFAPLAIVKMGMGLLRVPADLSIPILSYHHGDPRYFRGRPAGFYEMLSGEAVVGQVVQILSSRLDGGSVVAFAQSRVHAHSYRST